MLTISVEERPQLFRNKCYCCGYANTDKENECVLKETYLCAAMARLFRYFCAVITPTNKKLSDLELGFSVTGEPLSCGGHNTPPYSFLRARFKLHPAGLAFRFCPAFFSSVALGKMSLDARVNPTTSPSRTLNHALLLRPAIPQNFTSPACVLTAPKSTDVLKLRLGKKREKRKKTRLDRSTSLVSTDRTHSLTLSHSRKALFFQLPT